MSRQIWLACALASVTGCAACSKPAGNQQKDTGPTGPEHVKLPTDTGPGPVAPPTDDARFHLHPDEGTMTIDKAACKAGGEAVANVVVTPASGLHLATDFPISMKLEPATGVKLAKTELNAGGRDRSQGDASSLTEKELGFAVKATCDKAGTFEIKGTFKFGVCDKESCHPKKQPISISVTTS